MPETKEQVAKQVKPTPGPWRWWDRKSRRPEKYDLAKLYGADGSLILTMYGGEGADALGDDSRDRANARLIAAAPNLKDGCNALLGLLQLLAARDDVSDDLRKALTSGHRIDEARAAVAKSEGH
jgi:hypothetical protein